MEQKQPTQAAHSTHEDRRLERPDRRLFVDDPVEVPGQVLGRSVVTTTVNQHGQSIFNTFV